MPFICRQPFALAIEVPSTRSTGNWFGTTRRLQPGPLGAALRWASMLARVISSCHPERTAWHPVDADGLEAEVGGRLRRSVEMMDPAAGHRIFAKFTIQTPSRMQACTPQSARLPLGDDDRNHVEPRTVDSSRWRPSSPCASVQLALLHT